MIRARQPSRGPIRESSQRKVVVLRCESFAQRDMREDEKDKKAADVLFLMSGPHLYVFAERRTARGQERRLADIRV